MDTTPIYNLPVRSKCMNLQLLNSSQIKVPSSFREYVQNAYEKNCKQFSTVHESLLERVTLLATNRGYSYERRLEKINNLLYNCHLEAFTNQERAYLSEVWNEMKNRVITCARKGKKIKNTLQVVKSLKSLQRDFEEESGYAKLEEQSLLISRVSTPLPPSIHAPYFIHNGRTISHHDITNLLLEQQPLKEMRHNSTNIHLNQIVREPAFIPWSTVLETLKKTRPYLALVLAGSILCGAYKKYTHTLSERVPRDQDSTSIIARYFK